MGVLQYKALARSLAWSWALQGLELALEVFRGGASWNLYTFFRKKNRNQLSVAYSDFSSGSDRRCTFSAMPNPW